MRRMWPALLLWFCLSWVLLLHLWIKSVLQILEEFCLLGESQLLCHVPEVIYLGLLNCGFTFLLSILFETSFFLWVLFSGFYVLKITTAKSWLPWQLFCCPLPPPPPPPLCLLPAEMENSQLSGRWQHLLPVLLPIPVLHWRSWMASFS